MNMGGQAECCFQAILPQFSSWFSSVLFHAFFLKTMVIHLVSFVCSFMEASFFSIFSFFGGFFMVVSCFTLLQVSPSFLLILAVVAASSPEVLLGCCCCCCSFCFHTLLIFFSSCNCWDFCFRLWVQTRLINTWANKAPC